MPMQSNRRPPEICSTALTNELAVLETPQAKVHLCKVGLLTNELAVLETALRERPATSHPPSADTPIAFARWLMSWSLHTLFLTLNTSLSLLAGLLLIPYLNWGHAAICTAVLWIDGLLIHIVLALWRADQLRTDAMHNDDQD